jgi:ribosome-associated translation inhibitor RaiA
MTAPVDFAVEGEIASDELEDARREFEKVWRAGGEDRLIGPARVTLRHVGDVRGGRPYVADASALFEGRTLAAHAAGATAVQAAEQAADRLLRQLRRIVDADVALRNEPRVIRKALESLPESSDNRPEGARKPPQEREIVRRRPYLETPLSTLEAVNELLDLDVQFFLFRHVRTSEDVVVHRRDDGRIGLLFPKGSVLADENDVVVPEPSRYEEPISLRKAREEMDWLNHRFLYFIDADDGRGKVLYLRHDGDYGLVAPA